MGYLLFLSLAGSHNCLILAIPFPFLYIPPVLPMLGDSQQSSSIYEAVAKCRVPIAELVTDDQSLNLATDVRVIYELFSVPFTKFEYI